MSYEQITSLRGSINREPLLNESNESLSSVAKRHVPIKNDLLSETKEEDIELSPDPVDRRVSPWNQFTRFIASGSSNLFRRWVISMALCRSTVSYSWLRGHSPTTLVQRQYLKRVALIHAFFDGMDTVTKTIWPITCMSLLAYDYVQYQQSPQLRYQNQWQDIMLGLSPNNDPDHGALLSHMGSDIPSELTYWAGCVAVFGGTCTMGMMNLIWRAFRFDVPDHMYGIPHLNEDNNHRLCKSVMTHHMLNYLWDDAMPDYAHQPTVQQLRDMSDTGSVMRRGRALYALADIVDSFLSSDNEARKQEALEAESALREIARPLTLNKNPLSVFSFVYANYQLWRIGRHRSKRAHAVFYMTITLPQAFFFYHIWRLFLQKIVNFADFKMSEQACHQEGKFWRLMDQIGNYACLTCDSPVVDYPNAQSGQGCLTQSLQVQQDSDDVVSLLNDLSAHGPFSSFDLSQQRWWGWSANQWQQIANQLVNYPDELFQVMNLSTSLSNNRVIPLPVLQRINTILYDRPMGVLDLQNQFLGDAGVGVLLNGLNPQDIQHLNLSGCGLTDTGIMTVSNWIINNRTANQTQLQTLRLANNNFTAYGIEALFQALVESDVTALDIRNNLISNHSLSVISSYVDLTNLERFDLSNNDLSDANMTTFGQALANTPSLQVLRMQHCNLGDRDAMTLLPYINGSGIVELDWSNNEMGYMCAVGFSTVLPQQPLTHLYLSNNQFDDAAVQLLSSALQNSSVTLLDIGDNPITSIGFAQLVNQSHVLRSLYVDNTNIGGFSMHLSNNWLIESQLQQLSLRNTGLSTDDLTQLSQNMSNSTLTHLWVGHNRLSDAFPVLSAQVIRSNLRYLDVSQGQMSPEVLMPFIAALPESQLAHINLENNYFSSDNGVALAQTLVTDLPQRNDLATMPYHNRDFFRALHRTSANTQLSQLQLAHNALDDEAVHALCLVLPQTVISVNQLDVSDNLWQPNEINVLGCPVNASMTRNNNMRMRLLESSNENDPVNNHQPSVTFITSPGVVVLMLMAATSAMAVLARTSLGRLASGLFGYCRRGRQQSTVSPEHTTQENGNRLFNHTVTPLMISIDQSDENRKNNDHHVTF